MMKMRASDENTIRVGPVERNFKPIWIFMWVLGIPLQHPKLMPKGFNMYYILAVTWSLFLFFLNVGINLFLFWNPIPMEEDQRTRPAWNGVNTINSLNLTFSLPVAHLGWLAATVPNWNKGLLGVLLRMDQENFIVKDSSIIKRFRLVFLVGFWLLLLVLLCLAGIVIQSFILYPADLAVHDVRYLFSIYLLLTQVVVCSFCRMVLILLDSLNRDIALTRCDNNPVIINRELLSEWQRRYQIIGDLVDGINSSYGFVLLVFMVFQTIWFIMSSFSILIAFTVSNSVPILTGKYLTLAFGVGAIVAFFLLAYQATSIKDLATKCAVLLRRFGGNDPTLCTQNLAIEVSLSIPKITACGFFDIDLSLIPIIVGTTLTYLLILFQIS